MMINNKKRKDLEELTKNCFLKKIKFYEYLIGFQHWIEPDPVQNQQLVESKVTPDSQFNPEISGKAFLNQKYPAIPQIDDQPRQYFDNYSVKK